LFLIQSALEVLSFVEGMVVWPTLIVIFVK